MNGAEHEEADHEDHEEHGIHSLLRSMGVRSMQEELLEVEVVRRVEGHHEEPS